MFSVAVTVYVSVPTEGKKAMPSVIPLSQESIAPLELVAVKVTFSPSQTVCIFPASIIGNGFTITSTSSVDVQPFKVAEMV